MTIEELTNEFSLIKKDLDALLQVINKFTKKLDNVSITQTTNEVQLQRFKLRLDWVNQIWS